MDLERLMTIQVFSDVINGYSEGKISDGQVFIKHFGPLDEFLVEKIKLDCYNKALSKKIPTNSEKLNQITKQGLWSNDKEFQIKIKESELKNALISKKNILLVSQIKQREKQIRQMESDLSILLSEKNNLLGLTAEKYAENKGNNYHIYYSLFKDKQLTIPFFDKEEFDQVDGFEMQELILQYNDALNLITIENIKKTALSNLFQSSYCLAENASNFLGKPIYQFTYYQNSLISYGSYYKSMLSELGDKINEEHKTDPDKLESIYISSKNIQKDKERNPNRKNIEYFGATQEDNNIIGVDYSKEDIESKLLKEKGFISMEDMIKYDL